MFVELLILFFLGIPRKKKKSAKRGGIYDDDYTTTGLLITDSLIRNDDGYPKTFNEPVEKDPFLNEEYDDGPDW